MPTVAVAGCRPAFEVPPDVVSPGGEAVGWFTSPPGGLVQLVAPCRATGQLGQWIADTARARLQERFPDATELTIVLDLSLLTSRESTFRSILGDAARELQPRCVRFGVVPPPGTAIYTKSLEVTVALLRGFGVNVELHRTVAGALLAYGLSAASGTYVPRVSLTAR